MNREHFYSGTGTGTACGTLLGIIPGIHLGDILQTVFLAAIGASVSFIVTICWKRLVRKRRR